MIMFMFIESVVVSFDGDVFLKNKILRWFFIYLFYFVCVYVMFVFGVYGV